MSCSALAGKVTVAIGVTKADEASTLIGSGMPVCSGRFKLV